MHKLLTIALAFALAACGGVATTDKAAANAAGAAGAAGAAPALDRPTPRDIDCRGDGTDPDPAIYVTGHAGLCWRVCYADNLPPYGDGWSCLPSGARCIVTGTELYRNTAYAGCEEGISRD